MKINEFLNKDLDVNILLKKFISLDESRKSQFVAKLIGLGVLVVDKDGNLKPGKEMSKEDVIKKLGRRGKRNKIKKKIVDTLTKER